MEPNAPADPQGPSWSECQEMLEQLPRLPLDERLRCFETLVRNPSPGIRNQTLRVGAAILPDDRLARYLREEADAVLRNAGLEILKLRGGRGFSLAVRLLGDSDPDVVLQSVIILDHLKDPRAFEPLRSSLRHPDPNVVQAAILAIGHLGDSRAIPDLIPFLEADPWLQIAAVEALGDLRSAEATRPLARLLTDLIVGPMAAEAIARVGGGTAFKTLARHWLRFEEDLDAEMFIGLLAHVREGLSRPPSEVPELRANIARFLDDPDPARSLPAARCLLAMGAGPEDEPALDLLARHLPDVAALPACLRTRSDLIVSLLGRTGPLGVWGLLLVAHFPDAVPPETVAKALDRVAGVDPLPAVVECLRRVDGPETAAALLDLYLRLPADGRGPLTALLHSRREEIRPLLARREDLPEETRLVLAAVLGDPPGEIARRLQELSSKPRRAALAQIVDRREIVRRLPWEEWLDGEADAFAALAADVAMRAEMPELVPRLREMVEERPLPQIVRALGALGDRASVPALLHLLDHHPALAPVLLESLGEIGGTEARGGLRRALATGDEVTQRIAYRALSMCATEEDEPLFRAAATHADWNVRLAAAEVLGRSTRAEHLPALAQLAADPVSVVSQRALSFLNP